MRISSAVVRRFVGGIGGPELVLVVLLFGAGKLPKLALSSGEAMGELQKGRAEVAGELQEAKARATEPVATDDADQLEWRQTITRSTGS